MKHLCKTLAMLLTLTALVGLFSLTAYAHDVPDASKKGSITVDFEYDNKTVIGGRLVLYQIAKTKQTDGNYSFENLPEFASFGSDMADMTSAELAQRLADYADSNNILPVGTQDNKTSSVTFPELPHGLYLIVQVEAAPGYEAMQPFLVTVPMFEDGRYVYDINAHGKTALQKLKATQTGAVTGNLPQTGQLNWPIPVLALTGCVLVLVGLACRRKNDHEK